ncbi:HNH endonuclease signature motif containing protein [Salmonella enterica]|uniref:HNH endonuclease signature motif containing protein n=1 Tax=Salmonella enterica TaxID=28901 RepID=UPI0003BDB2F8|nr:HNH endonuclease signature motif containing protein [Salmonella enterica]EBF8299837.1 HNH endonuclease [Salmonella enterica subsp. enterica serovar Mbandaka]
MSGNVCAFPGCQLPIVESAGTITGEICHIRAQNEGGPRFNKAQTEEERHSFDNLVLLCRRHHKIVDSQPDVYSVEALLEIKAIRENMMGRPEQATDGFYAKILIGDMRRIAVSNNSGNVAIDSPGAILANTVTVKTTKKTVKVNAPAGTIGANQDASRYIQYLITRYNEFAGADKTRRTKFSYGAISRNIEHNFRASWRLLSMDDFYSLCCYLQQRISKTLIAKSNTSKGYPSFSSYIDFIAKRT